MKQETSLLKLTDDQEVLKSDKYKRRKHKVIHLHLQWIERKLK